MAITPWLANYPWSDPIFQSFEVQQYLTVSGVNPAQTYAAKAPELEAPAKPAEEQAASEAPAKAAPKPKAGK